MLAMYKTETGKGTGIQAACYYQTQEAMTAIESLWVAIQMAGDLRRWRVHTLTDHLVFSFQATVFYSRE